MNLTTKVKTPNASWELSPGAFTISIGSCFATTIAERLNRSRFNTLSNPFGTLYNPLTISTLIRHAISTESYSVDDLYKYGHRSIPLNHATRFEQETSDLTLQQLNETDTLLRNYLEKSQLLILTLGTAWAYSHIEQSCIVGNCHKLPSEMFTRSLLSPDVIISELSELVRILTSKHPQLKIIITVSPVRHIRDSIVQNSRSKGVLLYAVGELCERFSEITYFPSYEIMMDELRDYRFYCDDLVQPSNIAKEIIWERFSTMALSDESIQFSKLYSTINRAMNHRFSVDSDTKPFAKKMLQKISHLEQQFPQISFQTEKEYFYSL